jgi:hypothetical protein
MRHDDPPEQFSLSDRPPRLSGSTTVVVSDEAAVTNAGDRPQRRSLEDGLCGQMLGGPAVQRRAEIPSLSVPVAPDRPPRRSHIQSMR